MPESHEFHEFDELDEVASEYFPSLEERISERGLTRKQALELAFQSLSGYRALATKCGLTHLNKPYIWPDLLSLFRQEVTSDRLELLIWLCVDGRLIKPCSDDELISEWIICTERSAKLTDFLTERREKNVQFHEIVKLSQTAKQCGMNSSDERHLRVFNALCEMCYADGCSDRNILLNNLACIGGMIAEFPFLEPVAPLVYYQVCVQNSRKLLEKPDYLPTLKNLFRYQEYNITQDNGKNFEQYLDYCEIFVVLKDCFPEADEPLCNAGFLQLSNLAEYCFEHAESGGRIPLTADGIAKTLPMCLFDVSSQEIPIWRTLELDKCDFFELTKRYSVIWSAAEKAASKLLLTDIQYFIEHGEELMADLLAGDISEVVRISNLDVARKVLVYAVKCRFESLLCENVGTVLHEYLNE